MCFDYINLIFYPIEIDVNKMTELIPEGDDEDSLRLIDTPSLYRF